MERYESPALEIIPILSLETLEQSQNTTEFILEPFSE